ncbi:uncharacterized protein [Clytia hemisphaerica]|uniref:EGF-like domain-containing protein n=1 Tax=Clytia hemisphaerica TaxID=252671 RepID=A0A7M5X390_9CNID
MLLSFLLNLLLLLAKADREPLWEPKNSQISVHKGSALVIVNHMRFRDLKTGYMWRHFGLRHEANAMAECAAACMDTDGCVNWAFSDDNKCHTYNFALRTRPRTTYCGYWGRTFEIKNPCTENLNLCEHGSICSPDRNTKTYQCINCSPPYTGKHCNETKELIAPTVLHDDILSGRNKSCRTLWYHFDIPNKWTSYFTHPWNDERKIKIKCLRYTSMITKVMNDDKPVTDLTADHLVDGLDLTVPNFRALTSFIQAYEKLVQFDTLVLQCYRQNMTNIKLKSVYFHFSILNYFINATNTRPEFAGKWWLIVDNEPWNGATSDGFISNSNVDVEERFYKNLFKASNGLEITFSDNLGKCLSIEDEWRSYTVQTQ